MTDLLWPGDERAGDLFTDAAILRAMVAVEQAWLSALVEAGIAPPEARASLTGLLTPSDADELPADAEAGGNPVIPLVALLRERLGSDSDASRWLHRGLTSQDVLDTALMLCLRDTVDRIQDELRAQAAALAGLTDRHRATVMSGRTLTQHAVPVPFGLKTATWLAGLLDAAEDLEAVGVRLPIQLGGAGGTLAGPAQLARLARAGAPERTALELTDQLAAALGLRPTPPWHTNRTPVTRAGDALVRCTDAYGRIANDVLTLSRPEIGELAEPTRSGRGGSSTMPQKVNPVLSVLLRRAALAAPGLGGQLHLAAAEARDERPDGAWHVEWSALRLLARRTAVAASQATELLAGLQVDADRMRATAEAAAPDLLAEARSLAELSGEPAAAPRDLGGYLGSTDLLVDAVLERAASYLKGAG
jgi:3-carboxy-cis,cis-muconate cycloisomerase